MIETNPGLSNSVYAVAFNYLIALGRLVMSEPMLAQGASSHFQSAGWSGARNLERTDVLPPDRSSESNEIPSEFYSFIQSIDDSRNKPGFGWPDLHEDEESRTKMRWRGLGCSLVAYEMKDRNGRIFMVDVDYGQIGKDGGIATTTSKGTRESADADDPYERL